MTSEEKLSIGSSGDFVIRSAGLEDVDEILSIEQRVFQEPWSRFMIWEEIQRPNGVYLAAVPAGSPSTKVLGYGSFYFFEDEAHLTNVAVAPEQQGQGIGTALVACLLELGIEKGVERFTLEVRASNIRAIDLYKKFGFRQEGIRKNYYPRSGEDALIFWSPEGGRKELQVVLEQVSLERCGRKGDAPQEVSVPEGGRS